MTHQVPVSVPSDLRPLFTCDKPGELIAYDLRDPLFQAIRLHHAALKSVDRYTKLLLTQDTDQKDGTYSPPAVTSAKAQMVTEVLGVYNRKRPNNAAALQGRIAELEETVRRKDLALAAAIARAQVAEAALAKAAGK